MLEKGGVMDRSFVEENARERKRLRSLVEILTDEQLSFPLGNDWTISVALAHLAFWDQRASVLIEKWQKEGIGPSPIDLDVVNEATRPLCLAVPPRAAAEFALTSALAIDQAIEQLAPDFMADIETKGQTVRLNRATHRHGHLEQIKQALGLDVN